MGANITIYCLQNVTDYFEFERLCMWNISTTLYYKCGGKPWRLVTARDGVCYIGIAFRRTDETTACCAAQMFLDSGDGFFVGNRI